MKILAIGNIKNGILTIFKREKFNDAVKNFPDCRVTIEIEKIYNKRSVQQNRSLFGIPYKILAGCLTEAWGRNVTVNEVHEFCKGPSNGIMPPDYVERLKEKYLNDPENFITNKDTGEIKSKPFIVTTTKMTTIEMMQYYRNLQLFGIDFFHVDIPDPDPGWIDNLYGEK